ncbi:MAG: DUF11 domain-containing protein [Opitutae bacterium]|nr:DUF11 domain-containing protein [Opitutae bacterium]
MGANLALRLRAGGSFGNGDRISIDYVTFTNSGHVVSLVPVAVYQPGVTVNVVSNLAGATPASLLSNYAVPAGSSVTVRIRTTLDVPLVATQFVNTAAATNPATPPLTASVTNVSVANSVGDRAWFDVDGDGIQDGGEPGLTGVTVRIYAAGSNWVATTTSGVAGAYGFAHLPSGTYFLEFDAPEDHLPALQDQGGNDALDSDIAPATGRTAAFALSGGMSDMTRDAGFHQPPASIGDFVWREVDVDGLQGGGSETGMPGVAVQLYDAATNLVATTNTTAAGFYSFPNLPPATYFLEFTAPPGFMFTLQNQGGDDAADSDVSRTTGRTAPFFLPVGTHDTRWDAGLVEIVHGLHLTKTSAAGSCLSPGDAITYTLTVVNTGNVTQTGVAVEDLLPAGLTYVPNSAFAVVSNATVSTVRDEFNAVSYSGQDGTRNWAVDWQEDDPAGTAGPVGNYVGVTNGRMTLHYLYVGDEAAWRWADLSAETNATLSFDWQTVGLDANEYLAVRVATSPGGPFTQLEQFGGTASGTASYDLTAYISTGTTVRFEAAPGTENWESGEYAYLDNIEISSLRSGVATNPAFAPPGLVSGQDLTPGGRLVVTFQATVDAPSLVTQLVNTASVSSPLQPPLQASTTNCVVFADVGVRKFVAEATPDMLETIPYILVASNNGPDTATGVVITDVLPPQVQYVGHSNGAYSAGSGAWTIGTLAVNASTTLHVHVTVRENTADLNITNTATVTGRDLFDPVADNDSSSVVIVPKGWATVGDRAWLDADGDGIQGVGEAGLADVTVRLYGAGSNLLAETTTGADGSYHFTNLPAGSYFLEFAPPPDYFAAAQDQGGDDALDSDIAAGTGRTAVFSLSGGADDTSWDAGFYRLGAIGDWTWEDVNWNGQQESGDRGLPNVVVRLYNAASNVVGVETTTLDGAYAFTDLVPGAYLIGFTPPPGYLTTVADVGDDATDSDPAPDTGLTATVTLRSGQTNFTVDAGFFQVVSIGDRVWFDANRDGIQNPGETNGFADVPVALLNTNGIIVAETTTDADGYYLFSDKRAGTYVIRFDLSGISTNDVVTASKAGGDDAVDSDAISGTTGDYAWTGAFTVGGRPPASGEEEIHLAVDLGISTRDSTRAEVAEVWGEWTKDGGRVAWRTGSEFGTAGFFVHRVDPETGKETRMSDILVPSAFNEAGSVYGLVDPEAREGDEGTYRLEEIELSGEARGLGTHAVRFAVPPPAAKAVRTKKAAAAKALAPAPRTAPVPAEPSSRLKVLVKKEGIHGVALTSIAAGMGLALEDVRAQAAAGELKIAEQGLPVPVLFDAERGRLVFHARPPVRDWYSHEAAYLISAGKGLAMPRREPGASSGGTVFPVRLHFEEDRFLFSMTQMPEDFYFWAGVVSQTNDLLAPRFPLDLTGFAGGDLNLKVRLMGWSATTNHPDHLAEISFNGAVAGSIAFDGQETAEAELTIPGAAVVNGVNTVMVNGVMKPGQSHSFFVVDWIEASFDRDLTPSAPVAPFRAGQAPAFSAGAYSDPLALALDEAGNPTWIADAKGELSAKAWAVAAENERFAVIESSAVPMLVPEPAAADAWFLSETNRIDYLVIASRALAPAAQELADYRAGQGLRVGVAVFEDLCDLMTGGLRTPQAIPALLRHAAATWAQAPKMVVLAGGGHYDYLGATFDEVNPLPPLLVQTPDGVCASDGLLADTGGDDRPDVAIGRLPALTAADLAAMIAKIKVYEAGFGSAWQNQLVLVADQGNSAGNFSDSNTKLAEWATAPYSVASRIDLDQMAIGPARASLMDAFHAGAGFIHYTGHGGLFNLSGKGLLTAADVAKMDNATRPPITVALSCLLGRYELPATDSLGELLMRRPQGGAVALLAPSGLSFNAPAMELGEAFYRAVLQDGVGTLGLAFLRARRSLRSDLSSRDTFAVYNLLGDPALRIAGNEMTNGAPASAEIFLQDLEQGYDGQPRVATARTEPAGLAVRFTYDGSAAAPTEAGSYAVVGVVADDIFVGSATGTLVVAKAEAVILLGALEPVYDGTPKNATATTVPAGLAVEFRYDGGTAVPTEAGSYAVVATVVDGNHQASTTGTWVVAKAVATVALAGLEQTYDGTPRRVTAATVPAGLAVAITYGSGDAPPVLAGRYAVSAEIEDPNFAGGSAGALVVAKAAQTIEFPGIDDPLAPDGVGLSAISSSSLPVGFAVVDGPGRILDGPHLSFTGAGAVSVMAFQAGDGNWEPAPDVVRTFHVSPILLSATDVNVREGGEGRFYVRLAYAPAAATAVTVARSGGASVLSVKSGAGLLFSPANWNVWQAVTLAAAADGNGDNETAMFRVSASGVADQFVEATALDIDIGPNLALASNGSRITGTQATKPEWLIDGVHGASANYGYTIWTNRASPGTMTLDLQEAMRVSRIRLLNWDWGLRAHQYRIESSLDGTTWSPLVDASEGEHRGWEDWAVEDLSIRYLRFTGLSNSANQYVCLAEWEVYGPSSQFQLPRPELSSAAVNVREAGEGRFHVRLDRAPEANVAVAVSRASGDERLSVQSGAALVFTPANWAAWQVVTLAAGEDENGANETATFRISAPGVADRVMKATALDIDIGENRARASLGSTITGTQAYAPERAIDGVHASSVNYGYPVWTNPASPGTLTLDLKVATTVSRIRLLNWDWGYRSHRYRIESSLDGANWSALIDASTGEHRGWEDWAVAARTARYLRFTALSNSANRYVCIAEWEVYAAPVEPRQIECLATAVNVREGGEGRFHVRLDSAPAGSVSVGVSRSAGDANLFVKSGANLTFTPANWNAWQTVTLAASEDANGENETATFRIAVPGGADRLVEATALDDDIGVNWARASNGSTISGMQATKPEYLTDAVHMSSANYGYTFWTNEPPGTITLDLKAATSVSRIRLLNWDWSYRVHQYRIESSLDGASWSPLVEASAGEHRGWEDWALDGRSARYLRLTGLSNSANRFVCIAEWEVYGERTPEPKPRAVAKAASPAEFTDAGSFPMTVVTSDDGPEHTNGWAAVDGDPNTQWTGKSGAGGYIAIGYDVPMWVTNLVVDLAEGSSIPGQILYSPDAREWRTLPEDLARNPVEITYLWLLFPEDAFAASEPRVIEIRPQP